MMRSNDGEELIVLIFYHKRRAHASGDVAASAARPMAIRVRFAIDLGNDNR
jgi:hypothetical protein